MSIDLLKQRYDNCVKQFLQLEAVHNKNIRESQFWAIGSFFSLALVFMGAAATVTNIISVTCIVGCLACVGRSLWLIWKQKVIANKLRKIRSQILNAIAEDIIKTNSLGQ